MKKRVLAILLALAMAFTCTACSSGQETTAAESGSGETESAGPSENSGRDVLNVRTSVEPDNKDPFFTSSYVSFYLFNCVLSTIVEQKEDGSFVPELATEWTVNDDMTQYTFTIREDAKFHDGTPVTAEDVAFSIETDMASPLHAENWPGLESVTVEGNVVTLTFSTTYRYGLGSASVLYVVPKALYQELGSEGYAEKLIGSGPYKLENYETTTGNYTLTRNEDYFGELPANKTINCKMIQDASTSLIALEKGELDWTGIKGEQKATVDANDSLAWESVGGGTSYYLYFNTKQAPFDNAAIRKAIAYAIDTENVALAAGTDNEAKSMFWADIWGEAPEVSNKIAFDAEKAASFLAEAGVSTPYDAGALIAMPQDQDVAVQIQSDLSKAGINVTIETVDINTWIQKLTTGDYLMTLATISYPPAAVNSLISAFKGGSPANYSYYDGADDILATLQAAKTDEEVLAAEVQLLEKLNEDVPVFQMSTKGSSYAFNKDLSVYHGGNRSTFLLDWSKFSWK